MKTVELFCGIGGFRLATDQSEFSTIWANDNEPLACNVYRSNFGDKVLHEGDIRNLWQEIPDHELLTAGFPCQPFSSAGKKQGIRDLRGTLFQVVVDILKKREPKFFILENVKRLLTMEQGKHFATILYALSELNYSIEWRLLNAKHFSLAQNRERVIIVGRRNRQPKPSNGFRGVLVTSDDFLGLQSKYLAVLTNTTMWRKIENHGSRFGNWGIAEKGSFVSFDLPCFSAASTPTPLKSILQDEYLENFDLTDSTLLRLDKNTLVNKFINGVEVISNQKGGARMGYTIFGINGIAPTLTASTSRHYERYKIGQYFRRLSNIEYARLQGFPDSHCREVKVYDQYTLLGNAVPPPMVDWVCKRLHGEPISQENKINTQIDFFAHA